jgi:hypothetical protein
MKNLSLIFLSLFLFVEIGNSQVIKIEVSEVFDSYGYDTSVFNFINNDSLVYDETRKVNGDDVIYTIKLTDYPAPSLIPIALQCSSTLNPQSRHLKS